MKIYYVIVLIIATAIATSEAQNFARLPKNVVMTQINCILNEGNCDRIGTQIKETLPEALNNGCRRCSPQQAGNARKLMLLMKTSFPTEWTRIVQRYGNRHNLG